MTYRRTVPPCLCPPFFPLSCPSGHRGVALAAVRCLLGLTAAGSPHTCRALPRLAEWRAIVTARGEVFTVPVEDGSTRNVTRTGDRREYSALWSPDGAQLAYLVDSRDGQTLILEDQDGMGEIREIAVGDRNQLEEGAVWKQRPPPSRGPRTAQQLPQQPRPRLRGLWLPL